uniref:DNA excision repair protein ERCC-6-like n=1 Tax=Leptobrachium leishanense TaxID=445787 RepID=A0A8C5QQX0_9ANUR
MEERERGGSGDCSSPASTQISQEQAEKYERFVKEAKYEAKNGNLLKSIELFQKAHFIYPSEKLKGRIGKLEEALQQLDLQEEQDDQFVDVLNSGFLVYKDLYNKLFEHQKEGIAFLYSLYRDGRKGGILADDMGLGKTIQVIAFLSGMFDAELIKCVLLIMPTTLISNWVREFEKWTPGMRFNEFHGTSKKERSRNLEKIQRRGGILITTYQMLLNNWQQVSTYNGREFVWDYIVLDEAHKIKTSSTKTAKSCYAIPAKNRVLLTGTPVQNNLRELWSLYDFALQGTLLGTSKTFKMEYENPITRAREKDSTPGEKALGLKISENLMKIVQPYFLRRTKSDVQNKRQTEKKTALETSVRTLAMPSLTRKNDLILWVYLSSIQEEVYRKFISLEQIKELLMTTRSPLAELNILKKLCDHPRLLSARACIQLGLDDDCQLGDGDHGAVTKFDHLSDVALMEESGKLMLLIELLNKLKEEGHRSLVFSQSRKMLDMIARILCNRGFKVMRIDGTVSLPDREKVISNFQSNRSYSVLLLTTQVGGVGLTLTAANRVIIFDPSWNPATDAQAVDRAYRIGQQENVVIYRLITCGTVEEKIYRRQIFKDSLIRQTTGDKKNPFRYFSKQELKELFSLQDTQTSSTQIQLQNMHAAQRKSDIRLDEHIAYLHTLNIFGISDHDLIYTQTNSQDDYQCEDDPDIQYIEQRVQKAHELMQLESQINEQLMDQVRKGSEGAWLRQMDIPERKKAKPVLTPTPVNSQPVTIDLTEDDIGNVSCQMTSMVLDSSGDEDEKLYPAPFANPSPAIVNGRSCSPLSPAMSVTENPHILASSLVNRENRFNLSVTKAAVDSSLKDEDMEQTYNTALNDFSSKALVNGEQPLTLQQPEMSSEIVNLSPSICRVEGELHRSEVENTSVDMKMEQCESSQSVPRPQLPCEFNLVLDDSMENEMCPGSVKVLESFMESSVAPEMEPFLLLDDSIEAEDCKIKERKKEMQGNSDMRCKVENSLEYVEKSQQSGALTFNQEGTATSNGDIQLNVDMDSEGEEIHFTRKKAIRRVLSDSETENSAFAIDENEMNSPFSSPSMKGISASTPKLGRSTLDARFSQSSSHGRRRSIASRRSFIQVAVEEATDVPETIDGESDESEEEDVALLSNEAKEVVDEELVPSEEEPEGETIPQEGESLVHSEEYNSFVKSSFDREKDDSTEEDSFSADEKHGETSTHESTGEVELISGEQVDCLAQTTNRQEVVTFNDSYSSLVKRGKALKDAGQVKEALNCLLKALDIRSDDSEVMMMTLNLYRQLP